MNNIKYYVVKLNIYSKYIDKNIHSHLICVSQSKA